MCIYMGFRSENCHALLFFQNRQVMKMFFCVENVKTISNHFDKKQN